MAKRPLTIALLFSIAGLLFAGYLTFTKLVLGACPLTESCPYLFGYPVCLYGLLFYFIIFFSLIALLLDQSDTFPRYTLIGTTLVGVLFSAYYTVIEYSTTCVGGCTYSLGLPTCVYGLAMYLVIFAMAIRFEMLREK